MGDRDSEEEGEGESERRGTKGEQGSPQEGWGVVVFDPSERRDVDVTPNPGVRTRDP